MHYVDGEEMLMQSINCRFCWGWGDWLFLLGCWDLGKNIFEARGGHVCYIVTHDWTRDKRGLYPLFVKNTRYSGLCAYRDVQRGVWWSSDSVGWPKDPRNKLTSCASTTS